MADSKKFQVGSFYRYEEVMPSCCDLMADIVEAKTGSREETLVIEGPVIYNNGTTAIVRVEHMFMELDCYTLFYDEVCERFNDFAAIEERPHSPTKKYLCININSQKSRFCKDEETGEILETTQDEDNHHDFEDEKCEDLKQVLPPEAYERLEKQRKNITKADNVDFHDKPPVKVSLSLNATFRLKRVGVLEQVEDDSVMCQGFNRAYKWLTTCNCAIVTAWRKGNTREINDKNNRALQRSLRKKGYGVSKVKGYYIGVDNEVGSENSFLVFDHKGNLNLRDDVYKLSEKYEQDCFLYCEKGDAPATLIGTNDQFGKNRCEELGPMKIDIHRNDNFTEIGNRSISF